MHYEGCFRKAMAFSIGYYAFSMGDWVKNVPRIVPQCNSRQNRPSLLRNLLTWPMYKVIITDFQNLVQFDSYRPYRPFWHDVTSAMFASQNNKTAGMLVFQTNPVVVEPFSNVKAFFCCNKSTQLLVTLVKTLYIFLHNLTLRYTKQLSCRYPIHIRPYLSMLEIHFIVRDPGSRDRCP